MDALRISFTAMAGRAEVMLGAASEADARRLAQVAIDEVQRIEAKYSRYRPDSIVSRLNAAAGQRPVVCDGETAALFGYADALFDASEGLFDITSGVLRRAWNFREPRVPSAAELRPLLALIGWREVQRDGMAAFLPRRGMEIDFGGFGKEYAADRAATLLQAAGVRHGYVNLAGDMRIVGPRPDGQPWSIGIQDPRRSERLVASIPMQAGGLATSGDYERFFELDGRRYCHVLDPRSGVPVTHWRSVSVVAPVAVAAGSTTTIAMLQGEAGLAFLRASGLVFLAIDEHGEMHTQDSTPVAAAAAA